MMFNLSFVVVSFNSEKTIEKCVRSAAQFMGKDDCIVVVDNASSDDTRDLLAVLSGELAQLKVILLEQNIGFGPANNIGFISVDAEWFFLLNSDAWFVRDSAHEAIEIISDEASIAVCGLPLVFPHGQPQTHAYPYSSWPKWLLQIGGLRKIAIFLIKNKLFRKLMLSIPLAKNFVLSSERNLVGITSDCYEPTCEVGNVDWVCGAAMLLRGDFLRLTGGFDPNIFLYGEDEDLCITAHKQGKRVVTCDVFPVVHVFGWGKNLFDPVIARLKYDSLIYFINKNISSKFDRTVMKVLLPLHVCGWSFMSIPIGTLNKLKILIDKITIIPDVHGIAELTNQIYSGTGISTVGFVNAHACNIAARNPIAYLDILNLDFILRDGIGIELNMKLLGRAPGYNMNGTDYIPSMISEAVKQRFDILLLGTESPYNECSARSIKESGGRVLVVEDGFHEIAYYIDLVNSSICNDSLVILAMGMPKQERVAAAIRKELSDVEFRVVIVCGGAILDFMGGRVQRAPNWVRRFNVEWVYRLLREPRRLFNRYVVGNVVFLLRSIIMVIYSRFS
ncbi:MAG: WecB/TagA/CpsF family glycosyltransferase [Porticoccaceae bacterium]